MVTVLETFVSDKVVLQDLITSIRRRTLPCENHVVVRGDHRFWGVKGSSPIVSHFKAIAIKQYVDTTCKQPRHVIIMANHISAENSPEGSGGGWHVDSFRDQYKLFMYLTDCTRNELGPLTLLTCHPVLDRAAIAVNYLAGGASRFSGNYVRILQRLGYRPQPMLFPKLKPFFVNTSYIHRGAPITEGERIMLTAYIFANDLPESIASRVMPHEQV